MCPTDTEMRRSVCLRSKRGDLHLKVPLLVHGTSFTHTDIECWMDTGGGGGGKRLCYTPNMVLRVPTSG